MLTLLCLAQFMLILDITVVNVALPDMAADLHLGQDGSALGSPVVGQPASCRVADADLTVRAPCRGGRARSRARRG
jgi:MFS family permease